MYIQVKLLQGYQEPLLYSIPDQWGSAELIGSIVTVPFRTMSVPAFVTQIYKDRPITDRAFAIKEAISREAFPHDPRYQIFIKQLANYYQVDELFCIKRMRQFLTQKELPLDYMPSSNIKKDDFKDIQLTEEQQSIVNAISPTITSPSYNPTLIHGVTGSGKTEVYKKLLTTAIQAGKTAILLLPEVTLAMQFQKLLRNQLPASIELKSFHSASSIKEKKTAWHMLLNEQPLILLGVHLPILLPISNLGLIIVDEEHEAGYQEKKHPKINSKEAAIWRAHACSIPIVLGSATPSISSLYNVHARGWQLFKLTKRYAGAFPKIKTVVLINKQKRKNFWISNELYDAIKDRLSKKEQTIIFLNRRGFSFFIQCTACSHIPSCSACSVSLTLHEEGHLSCHYCGYSCIAPTKCPSCTAGKDSLLKRGIGTQQVVRILEQMFPQARVGRADMDTTTKKKLWHQTLTDFEQGHIDILVGTQTITKGFHFPRVTLAGILWADVNLHFPIYNASETTLQQLIQVAGRAGRQSDESLVIVQTMADHEIFSYLNEIEYSRFYETEIESRSTLHYPPCARLLEIELKHTIEQTVDRESHILANFLSSQQNRYQSITILGPAKPPVAKINNIFIRKIYLKGPNMHELLTLIKGRRTLQLTSSIHIIPNPLH